MLSEGSRTIQRALTAVVSAEPGGQSSDQITPQRTLPGAQPQHVRHVHEAGGATADPVGILLGETLHTGDDESTLGGVIRHVGSQVAASPGQILGLLEGEAVTTHQHLQMTVIPEAHHHSNTGQVVANPLPHADAVGALVARRRILEIVVEAVESADEGVVTTGLGLRQLAVAEIDAAVVTNSNEGPLTGRRAVAPLPDATTELEISERNGDFPPGTVHMPLIHRTGHIGEGGAVLEGI